MRGRLAAGKDPSRCKLRSGFLRDKPPQPGHSNLMNRPADTGAVPVDVEARCLTLPCVKRNAASRRHTRCTSLRRRREGESTAREETEKGPQCHRPTLELPGSRRLSLSVRDFGGLQAQLGLVARPGKPPRR